MKIKQRLQKLESTVNTNFYKVVFKDGTYKNLNNWGLLEFSMNAAREKVDSIEKIESVQNEENKGWINLCMAIARCYE